MRGRVFNLGKIGRAAGLLAVAAAIVATAVHFRHGAGGGFVSAHDSAAISRRPLADAMARCRAMGLAATGDASCEAAWAENRRRFFTYGASPIPVAPTASINRLATAGAK